MLCGDIGSLLVLNGQGIEILMKCIHKDNRNLVLQILIRKCIGHRHGKEQNPVDPAPQGIMPQGCLNLIRVVDAIKNQVAVELTELCLNTLKDFEKEERREERNDCQNGIRSVACKASCVGVR